MNQPDVTLTDYGLAIECALFVVLLARTSGAARPLRDWFVILFGSLGVGALAGGTVHGFFPDPTAPAWSFFWAAILLALGVTALSAWAAGAHLLCSPRVARWILLGAVVEFIAYGWVALLVVGHFWVAVVNYLPAAAFLLVALIVAYRRTRARPVAAGLVGLGVTFLAAGLREARVMLPPVYFDHNALYHLLQAVGLWLLFLAARRLVHPPPTTTR